MLFASISKPLLRRWPSSAPPLARDVRASAKKSAGRRKGAPAEPDDARPPGRAVLDASLGGGLDIPVAPPPTDRPKREDDPEYPVFKRTRPDRPRSWDDGEGSGGGGGSGEPLLPEWDPKTGFARKPKTQSGPGAPSASAAPGSAASEAAAAAAPAAAASSGGAPIASASNGSSSTAAGAAAAGTGGGGPLQPASRGQVLSAAAGASFWMTVLALVARPFVASSAPAALHTDPQLVSQLMSWPAVPQSLTAEVGGYVAAAVGVVTAARFTLLAAVPSFREATDTSNRLALTNLSWADIALISVMAGVSEELLFRGTVLPGTFPDWRGALLAGAVFGVLHTGGGRNATFALWAGGVGALYGGLLLKTGNIYAAMAAHSVANVASAALWMGRSSGSVGGSGSGSKSKTSSGADKAPGGDNGKTSQ